jgi:hypothetical protein
MRIVLVNQKKRQNEESGYHRKKMTTVSQPFSLTHFINSIPLPQAEKTARYPYLSYCYGKGKIFGENYASLIADFFGLKAENSIEITQRLSAYLRAYTVVDDDLMDTPQGKCDKAWVALRSFFMDCVFREIDSLEAEGINAHEILESELAIYYQVKEMYTRRHARYIEEVDGAYIERYADRMATVRVPIRVLGSKAQNQKLTVHGCCGIDGLIKALQILDDLVDWKEDFSEGRITYPLVCYLAALSDARASEKFCPNNFTELSKVLDSSLHNLITLKHLELTTVALDDAIGHLSYGKANGLLRYVGDIRHRVRGILLQKDIRIPEGDDLLIHVLNSGLAPKRSIQEKGYLYEH